MSQDSPEEGPPKERLPDENDLNTTSPTENEHGGHRQTLPIREQLTRGSPDEGPADQNEDENEPDNVSIEAEDDGTGDIESPYYSLSELPLKTGKVSAKNDIELTANYFKIQLAEDDNDIELHRYFVKFPENIKARSLRRQILALYIESVAEPLATDYNEILIAKQILPPNLGKPKVKFREADGDATEEIEFDLVFEKSLSLSSLYDDLGNVRPDSQKLETIQALNIIAGSEANKTPGLVQVRRTQYFPMGDSATPPYDLGGGLRAIRGFFSSVRPADGSLMLNLNVSTACFYDEGNLIDLARTFGYPGGGRSTSDVKGFLRGLRLSMDYLKKVDPTRRRRVRVVTDLPRAPDGSVGDATNTRFNWTHDDQAENVTVEEYYNRQYPGTLHQPNAIVVDVGSKREANNQRTEYIPAELCELVPGQLFSGRLSFTQSPKMILFACKDPAGNAKTIMEDGRDLFGLEEQTDGFSRFGLRVDREFLSVRGRRLESPLLLYRKVAPVVDQKGSWRASWPFHRTLPQSSLLSLAIYRDETLAKDPGIKQFVQNLGRQLQEYGVLDVNKKPIDDYKSITFNLKSTVDNLMTKALNSMLEKVGQGPHKLLVIIIPRKDSAIYEAIKYAAEVKYGVQTVFCIDPTKKDFSHKGGEASKRSHLSTFAINLSFKINTKFGGFNHVLDPQDPRMQFLGGNTMVVGIDVTHPAPGSGLDAKSVAGVVASMDNNFAQFPGSIRIQTGRQEMVQELSAMMQERLDFYKSKSKKKNVLPDRIVIFRDGVSEGQLEMVLEEEKEQLDELFGTMYRDQGRPIPTLTIIVVDKRHHTRFYSGEGPNYENPKAGTIVDSVVTMPRNLDFFLQAHHALKGTARPTRYILLWDENGWTTRQIETLSHTFCYTSARCTKALSIPAPVFYADLLCERAAKHLKVNAAWDGTLHDNIKNTMFYI